jgi:hypothetical protein
MDAGVRVFFYLEDRERTLDTAIEKVMLGLTNFAAEMEREKAQQRTRDAMTGMAKRGAVTGGKLYGYDTVTEPAGTLTRVINKDQAEVVRRMYRWYADGRGSSGSRTSSTGNECLAHAARPGATRLCVSCCTIRCSGARSSTTARAERIAAVGPRPGTPPGLDLLGARRVGADRE